MDLGVKLTPKKVGHLKHVLTRFQAVSAQNSGEISAFLSSGAPAFPSFRLNVVVSSATGLATLQQSGLVFEIKIPAARSYGFFTGHPPPSPARWRLNKGRSAPRPAVFSLVVDVVFRWFLCFGIAWSRTVSCHASRLSKLLGKGAMRSKMWAKVLHRKGNPGMQAMAGSDQQKFGYRICCFPALWSAFLIQICYIVVLVSWFMAKDGKGIYNIGFKTICANPWSEQPLHTPRKTVDEVFAALPAVLSHSLYSQFWWTFPKSGTKSQSSVTFELQGAVVSCVFFSCNFCWLLLIYFKLQLRLKEQLHYDAGRHQLSFLDVCFDQLTEFGPRSLSLLESRTQQLWQKKKK